MRFKSNRFVSFSTYLGALLLCAVLPAGCNPMSQTQAMDEDPDYPSDPRAPSPSGMIPAIVPTLPNGQVHIDTSKPIPFDHHEFGIACYDTFECKVTYHDFQFDGGEPDGEKTGSSASLGDKYPDTMAAGYLGIRNFPLPAKVSWRDKDGHAHEASIDIAAIFKEQIVLHKVPQDQLPAILTANIDPDIILEVNDRTINVWMRAHVPTKVLQKPDNIYSDFRNDIVLAFSKAY